MACGKPQATDSIAAARKPAEVSCKDVNDADRQRLISSIAKINIGDSQAVVESVVGVPAKTESLGTKNGDRIVATASYYFVKKCGDNGQVRNEDAYVRLLFHIDGHLSSVEAFGVDGVKHRSDIPPPGKDG